MSFSKEKIDAFYNATRVDRITHPEGNISAEIYLQSDTYSSYWYYGTSKNMVGRTLQYHLTDECIIGLSFALYQPVKYQQHCTI